jgi:hypothetical protein
MLATCDMQLLVSSSGQKKLLMYQEFLDESSKFQHFQNVKGLGLGRGLSLSRDSSLRLMLRSI